MHNAFPVTLDRTSAALGRRLQIRFLNEKGPRLVVYPLARAKHNVLQIRQSTQLIVLKLRHRNIRKLPFCIIDEVLLSEIWCAA
jgi:hypothetical protein